MKNVKSILKKLVENTGANGAMLANSEGMVIEAINMRNENRTAVMIASIHAMGQRFVADMDKGNIEQFYIKAKGGYILLKDVNKDTVLCLDANEEAKLGFLMMYLDESSKELASLLSFA